MNYLDEFRDPATAKKLADAIKAITTQPWNIMEVCGGQTHSIIKYGIDQLLPDANQPDPRPRLSGLRHAAGLYRQGAGDCRATGGDFLLFRRHAARPRLAS